MSAATSPIKTGTVLADAAGSRYEVIGHAGKRYTDKRYAVQTLPGGLARTIMAMDLDQYTVIPAATLNAEAKAAALTRYAPGTQLQVKMWRRGFGASSGVETVTVVKMTRAFHMTGGTVLATLRIRDQAGALLWTDSSHVV